MKTPKQPNEKYSPCSDSVQWEPDYLESPIYVGDFIHEGKLYAVWGLIFDEAFSTAKKAGIRSFEVILCSEESCLQMGRISMKGTSAQWAGLIEKMSGKKVKQYIELISKRERYNLIWPAINGLPMAPIAVLDLAKSGDPVRFGSHMKLCIFAGKDTRGEIIYAWNKVEKNVQTAEDHYRLENRLYRTFLMSKDAEKKE